MAYPEWVILSSLSFSVLLSSLSLLSLDHYPTSATSLLFLQLRLSCISRPLLLFFLLSASSSSLHLFLFLIPVVCSSVFLYWIMLLSLPLSRHLLKSSLFLLLVACSALVSSISLLSISATYSLFAVNHISLLQILWTRGVMNYFIFIEPRLFLKYLACFVAGFYCLLSIWWLYICWI